MKINLEQIKEIQALYYDVAVDSDNTETRDYLKTLEIDGLLEAGKRFDDLVKELGATNKSFANTISDAGCDLMISAETNGFIKGFLYAKALLVG